MQRNMPWSRLLPLTSDALSVLTVTLHPSFDRVLRGDHLRPDDITRTHLVMEYAGGKGINVARALTRMGLEVTAIGFQGGPSGQIATNQLVSEGISTHFVNCEQSTRISTMLHEEDTGTTYAVYESGQQVTDIELNELFALFEELVKCHEIVLLCGSAQTDALQSVYYEMIAKAQAYDVPVLLDSSGRSLKQGILAKPYLVKVNQHELEAVLEKPLSCRSDQVNALLVLHRMGIRVAALTVGEDGLIATDGYEIWQGVLGMRHVINTVGCGDSTLAGMAYAISHKAELADIVRWGTACGAANTQYHGAGFITAELVNKLFPLVQLNKLTSFT